MKFDSYTLIARLLPGILGILPFYVLHYYLLKPLLGEFWGNILGLVVVSDVTTAIAMLYLLIQLGRIVSKRLFEDILFRQGFAMPTADLLLHSDDTFSEAYKRLIHERIKGQFGLAIPDNVSENSAPLESRRMINDAVSLIRQKVGKGRLLVQHNAEYGFFRNLAGISTIAAFGSLLSVLIFRFVESNDRALAISAVLFVVYSAYILIGARLISYAGHKYARVLIQEYMG